MSKSGREPKPTSFLYVHDSRTCVGHVIGRGKLGWEAFDHDDNPIGIFKSAREAAAALPGREP